MSQLPHAQFPLRRHPDLLVDHRRVRSAAVAEPRGANADSRDRLRWPASFRNGGRNQIGTVADIKSESPAGLRRNSQVRVQLPSSTQHLEVRTPDGESLKGIRTPCREEAAQNAPTLLGFGGNAWNARATALTLHRLFPNRDVVAFHYRGYAPSNGRPSAEALMSDSLAIFDSLRQGQIEEPIVAVGFSIGSGVAAYLARHRPIAGLILVTPFDSLEALALDLYWWAPVGLLFRHRMRTIEFVRGTLAPTALITAERDKVVPARRSTPLRAAIKNLVFERDIDSGHNDIYEHPAFATAMREALTKIEATRAEALGL